MGKVVPPIAALLVTLAFVVDARAESPPVTCSATPAAQVGKFRHKRSRMLVKLGSPRHRGIDLIASEDAPTQTLGGKVSYTKTHKDLEDEDVEVFACLGGAWKSLGTSRSDGDGRFTLKLGGTKRLPVGMTDLYAHVVGDGSGVRFLGYVAPRGASVIVTDIDGTITESEGAIWDTVLYGNDIEHQPGAPEVLQQSGKTIIYVSARGDQYTEVTRGWLRAHGFPVGPIRHAASFVTRPGSRTVGFKASTLRALGVTIAAGIGNRASDVTAYRAFGLPAERIFMNLPEFEKELAKPLAAKHATGFDAYRELAALLAGI